MYEKMFNFLSNNRNAYLHSNNTNIYLNYIGKILKIWQYKVSVKMWSNQNSYTTGESINWYKQFGQYFSYFHVKYIDNTS